MASIDESEIEKFNQLKSIWWNKSLLALHSMNKLRVPLVKDGLFRTGAVDKNKADPSKPLAGLLVLDVGCGGGICSEELAKLGCTVVGVDNSSDLIQVAKDHAAEDPSLTDLTYKLESIEDHAVKNFEKYDAVVASEVVEHVNNPEMFLEQCIKCLKPGGSIFVTTLNKTWASWLIGIIFYEYVWKKTPKGTHTWDKFISPQDVTSILSKYNCKTTHVRGMVYNLLDGSWFWSWYDSINYALQGVKIQ